MVKYKIIMKNGEVEFLAESLKQMVEMCYMFYIDNDSLTKHWFLESEKEDKVNLFKEYLEQIRFPDNLVRFFNMIVPEEFQIVSYTVEE